MRKYILSVFFISLLVFFVEAEHFSIKKRNTNSLDSVSYRSGDIIFQTTTGGQSMAIKLATHSKYTHVGMIFYENNIPFVYEAVQPVKKTPLIEWIDHGVNKHFVVKRLIKADSVLSNEVLNKIKLNFNSFVNKNYDLYFGWSDDKLYCSELVWKLYKNATGLEIGKLHHLKDFDLSSEIVKKKLKERYGNKIPYDEIAISPQAIFDSKLITTVITK